MQEKVGSVVLIFHLGSLARIPLHTLASTIVGWGILSPCAKNKGYAPGDIEALGLFISPFRYAWLEGFRSSQLSVGNFEPVPHPTSAYDTFASTRQTTASLGSPP